MLPSSAPQSPHLTHTSNGGGGGGGNSSSSTTTTTTGNNSIVRSQLLTCCGEFICATSPASVRSNNSSPAAYIDSCSEFSSAPPSAKFIVNNKISNNSTAAAAVDGIFFFDHQYPSALLSPSSIAATITSAPKKISTIIATENKENDPSLSFLDQQDITITPSSISSDYRPKLKCSEDIILQNSPRCFTDESSSPNAVAGGGGTCSNRFSFSPNQLGATKNSGNYFRFPEITTAASTGADSMPMMTTTTTQQRWTRLKSISLDRDTNGSSKLLENSILNDLDKGMTSLTCDEVDSGGGGSDCMIERLLNGVNLKNNDCETKIKEPLMLKKSPKATSLDIDYECVTTMMSTNMRTPIETPQPSSPLIAFPRSQSMNEENKRDDYLCYETDLHSVMFTCHKQIRPLSSISLDAASAAASVTTTTAALVPELLSSKNTRLKSSSSLSSAHLRNKLHKNSGNVIVATHTPPPSSSSSSLSTSSSLSSATMVPQSIAIASTARITTTITTTTTTAATSNNTSRRCFFKRQQQQQHKFMETCQENIERQQQQRRQRRRVHEIYLKDAANVDYDVRKNFFCTSVDEIPSKCLHDPQLPLSMSSHNLRTLPEQITIVDFASDEDDEQQSMKQNLSKSKRVTASAATGLGSGSGASNIRCSNLQQRRGSNQSLVLNVSKLLPNDTTVTKNTFSNKSSSSSLTRTMSFSNYNLHGSNYHLNKQQQQQVGGSSASKPITMMNKLNVSSSSSSSISGTTMNKNDTQSNRRENSPVLKNVSRGRSCISLNRCNSHNSLSLSQKQPQRQQLPQQKLTSSEMTVSMTVATTAITKQGANTTTAGLFSEKRSGLLQRRGSNASLSLNLGSNSSLASRTCYVPNVENLEKQFQQEQPEQQQQQQQQQQEQQKQHFHQDKRQHRLYLSSEDINNSGTSTTTTTMMKFCKNMKNPKEDAGICFGSVYDLQTTSKHEQQATGQIMPNSNDFNDDGSNSLRFITTCPLSPQSTTEDFKIYLANIQMLQNSTKLLSGYDLIRLNWVYESQMVKRMRYQAQGLLLHTSNENAMLMTTDENHEDVDNDDDDDDDADGDHPDSVNDFDPENIIISNEYNLIVNAHHFERPDDEEIIRLYRDLHQECWDLPLNYQEKPMVFGSQTKNRYKTILPNENSRVILEIETTMCDADNTVVSSSGDRSLKRDNSFEFLRTPEAPYINANYIRGHSGKRTYIATQGPLHNTIYDFWLMVKQNNEQIISSLSSSVVCNNQKIIMLTKFNEKTKQKCSVYFPIKLDEIFYASSSSSLANNDILRNFDYDNPFNDYLIENSDENIFESFYINFDSNSKFNQIKSNLFVIKNIAIMENVGYQIRKFITLHCTRIKSGSYGSVEEEDGHDDDDDDDDDDDNDDDDDDGGYGMDKIFVKRFICYHYWFADWPDHKSPKNINVLLDFCIHLISNGKCDKKNVANDDDNSSGNHKLLEVFINNQPMPIIHCSAGIGRTGCLIAILNGICQLRQSFENSLLEILKSLSPIEQFDELMTEKETVIMLPPISYDDNIQSHYSERIRNTVTAILANQSKTNINENNDYSFLPSSSPQPSPLLSLSSLPALVRFHKLPEIYVDLLSIVCNLRLDRGGMVQNIEQYELIHRAVALYTKRAFTLRKF